MANLLGVVFCYSGIMTAAPYRVLHDTHWCFAKTGLSKPLELHRSKNGCTCAVPGVASGHVTDKISPQSPTRARLLAMS